VERGTRFLLAYTILIVLGAAIILIPDVPLIQVMLWSQVINGVLLLFILIFMLQLINDRDLMGDDVNSKRFNIIAWVTTLIMIVLTLMVVVTSLFPDFFG
jgi:Mn2+/Fe2+ NRAMP family transporter